MINFQIHTNGVNVEKKILLLSPHKEENKKKKLRINANDLSIKTVRFL